MAVLNLDPVQDINEGQSAVLTGSLSDFEPDSEVTLVIDWGEVDINGNPITDGSDEVTVTATTDANGNLDLASLDLTYLYTDDNPTATPVDTNTISVTATGTAPVAFEVMIGDNDGYGFDPPIDDGENLPSLKKPADRRDDDEKIAKDGAQITDFYSSLRDPLPEQSDVIFQLDGTLDSATLEVDMGGFNAKKLGQIKVLFNGVEQPDFFNFQDGASATVIRSFELDADTIDKANQDGQFVITLDRNKSDDSIAFDYFKLSGEIIDDVELSNNTSVEVFNVDPTIETFELNATEIDDDDIPGFDDDGLLITGVITGTDPGTEDTFTGEVTFSDGSSTALQFDSFVDSVFTASFEIFFNEDDLENNFPEVDCDDIPGLNDDDCFLLTGTVSVMDDDTGMDTLEFEYYVSEDGGAAPVV